MPEDSAILEITAVREAWLEAVRSADISRLASLVADDVVIVHGDGRCLRGKGEFEADFLKAFEFFHIDQRVLSPEVTIRGDWAFEIARVETILTPIRGDGMKCALTTTLVAFRKQLDGTWKVARVIGLLD